MKKKLVSLVTGVALSALFFGACKKDEDKPQVDETPVVNNPPPVFNWKLNNTTSFSSDSTFCYPSFTTIYAFKSGLGNSIEINLSSLNTGTYSISSATGNALTLVAGSSTVNASSGKVTISANANNKISGTVTAAFSTGTITSLSGEFTDVPKRN